MGKALPALSQNDSCLNRFVLKQRDYNINLTTFFHSTLLMGKSSASFYLKTTPA
jgi:hypothetical protein